MNPRTRRLRRARRKARIWEAGQVRWFTFAWTVEDRGFSESIFVPKAFVFGPMGDR